MLFRSELEFHKAPLILVPVSIVKDSVNGVMQVKYNLEDIQANISLFYKLKEQDIVLPLFDKDMESIDDIYDYLELVKENIKVKESWFVSDSIYLSDFNFKRMESKFLKTFVSTLIVLSNFNTR